MEVWGVMSLAAWFPVWVKKPWRHCHLVVGSPVLLFPLVDDVVVGLSVPWQLVEGTQ
jgi:hypothetical protein